MRGVRAVPTYDPERYATMGVGAEPRWGRRLPTQTLLYSLPSGLFLASSIPFFTRYSGLGALQVGWVLSCAALVGAVALLRTGRLVDRVGHRRVWAVSAVVDVFCYLALPFCRDVVTCAVVMSVLSSSGALGNTARVAYTYNSIPDTVRKRVQSLVRMSLNVGIAAGSAIAAVLATVLADDAYWLIPAFAGALYAVNAFYIARLPPDASASGLPDQSTPARGPVLRDRAFILVAITIALLSTNEIALSVAFPLWMGRFEQVPPYAIGVMFVVCTVVVVALQLPATRLVGRSMRRVVLAIPVSGLMFGAGAVAMNALAAADSVAGSLIVIVCAAALMSLGQLVFSVVCWDVFAVLTTAERRAEYQSVWQLATQAGAIAAPILMTASLEKLDAGLLPIAAAFVGFGVLCVAAVIGSTAIRRRLSSAVERSEVERSEVEPDLPAS